MTTLGQAYVQIMPSAKGISGSIQKTINPEATAAGKSAGSRIASSMADSMSKAGKTLTKTITVPAAAAATAVGGIVAAFGWGRLKSVDSAQAQLRGLGYETEDVQRISNLLSDALEGGMMTMGEATSAAATAMASGVEEGKELTRYIQILDGTVAGSTGTFAEMEQIFGRIVDQGSITRNEFDMIAQRMPGFSKAVQDHMEISSDEMYEMLRNGEITTDQFLDIMEDFSGDMATEYAKSWSGMVENTKNYIGILGEHLLGGVFEQSKESIAEFIEFLSSDKVVEWAQQAGQSIGNAFNRIVEVVKSAINWWTNLDGSTRKLIMTIAGITVAIGPVLMILGKLITTIITVNKWFGLIKSAAAIVGAAIGAISTPVLVVIGVISSIIAIGVLLWKNWDTIKEKASQLGSKIAEIWDGIKTWTSETWENIKTTITEAITNVWNSITEWFGQLPAWFSETWNSIVETVTTFVSEMIEKAIELGTRFVENIVTFFNELPYKVGFFLGEVIGTVIKWSVDMWEKAKETGTNFITSLTEWFSQLPGRIANWLTNTWEKVTTWATDMRNKAIETGKEFINNIIDWFKKLPGRIQTWLSNAISRVSTWVSNMATKAREAGSRFINNAISFVKQLPGRIQTWLSNAITRVTTWARDLGNKGREAGSDLLEKVITEAKKIPGRILSVGKDVVRGFWDGITSMGSWIGEKVSGFFGGIVDGAKSIFQTASPSKVFRDEIGKMVVKGFGVGVESNEKEALNPIKNLFDDVISQSKDQKVMDEMLNFDVAKSARFNNSTGSSNNNDVAGLLIELIDAVREGKNIIMNEKEVGRVVEPYVSESKRRKDYRLRRSPRVQHNI